MNRKEFIKTSFLALAGIFGAKFSFSKPNVDSDIISLGFVKNRYGKADFQWPENIFDKTYYVRIDNGEWEFSFNPQKGRMVGFNRFCYGFDKRKEKIFWEASKVEIGYKPIEQKIKLKNGSTIYSNYCGITESMVGKTRILKNMCPSV